MKKKNEEKGKNERFLVTIQGTNIEGRETPLEILNFVRGSKGLDTSPALNLILMEWWTCRTEHQVTKHGIPLGMVKEEVMEVQMGE